MCVVRTRTDLRVGAVSFGSLLAVQKWIELLAVYILCRENSDQAAQIRGMLWVFAGCVSHLVGAAVLWFISD